MNILLLFFALPIATIILAIVLQKILKCPLLVAATFFAIYLIVTYAVFDSSFLVFAIAYTILAYITAVLTKIICQIIRRLNECNLCNNPCNNSCACNNQSCSSNSSNLATVSNGTWCCTSRTNPTITLRSNNGISTTNENAINTTSNGQDNSVIILANGDGRARNGCNCGCRRR